MRGKGKKLDVAHIRLKDGTSYSLPIMAERDGEYGPYGTFRITFPWGNSVTDKTVSGVIEKAEKEAEDNGHAIKEKIIWADLDHWDVSNTPEEQQASLSIQYRVGLRSSLPDGRTIYFTVDGRRSYDFDHNTGVTIPWTQAAEDSLANAVETINRIKAAMDETLHRPDFQNILEGKGLLQLPEHKEKGK